MINEFSRKESPLQGLTGLGGGIAGRLLSGVSGITVDDVFSVDLYSPSAATTTVNNGIDFAGEGGMVFRKRRDAIQNWSIHDTERGDNKVLYPNLTTAEGTSNNILTSGGFTSTGLVWDTGGHGGNVVNFSFRKCPKFFDIVTYTGDGTTNRNISHDLGSVPGMIIVKGRNFGSDPWYTYHRSTGNQGELRWTETDYVVTGSSRWASYTPTATHFRGDTAAINVLNRTYVAYLFAHDEQEFGTGSDEAIIHCGSYSGASTGPTITTGFEPQWVMIKRTDASANWRIYDSARGFTTGGDPFLKPNSDAAEVTTADDRVRPTSTGFQVCNSSVGDAAINNGHGSSYIYMAIRAES